MPAFITADGAGIAYDVAGDGPALLLIHAGIADRSMWGPVAANFRRTHRVVRLDLRGFGDSAPATAPHAHREDARALLDHLGIDRATVVGVSMGAGVAIDLALVAPERVRSLVVCSALLALFEPSDTLRAMWRAADDAFAGGDLERCVEIELAAWVDGVGRPAGTLPPAIREQARQMIRRTWERLRADGEPMDETPLVPPREERLGEVAVPTLVVVGELDQPDVLACCRELPKRIPGATLAVLPNAAHLPPLEQPVAFTSLLEAWLRRHRG